MVFGMIGGAVQGYLQSKAYGAAIDANNRISESNARAKNKVRQASNLASAAENSLARWVQSLNNNRVLDAGGEQMEANTVNYLRGSDAGLGQSFSETVRQAEHAGALEASAAANGTAGGVVDMVNSSTRLRDSMIIQQMEDMGVTAAYDAAQRGGQILMSTVQGMDGSLIMDTMDYNIDTPQVQAKMGSLQNAFFGFLTGMGASGKDPRGVTQQEKAAGSSEDAFGSSGGYKLNEQDAGSLSDYHNIGGNSWNFQSETSDPYSMWGSDQNSTGDTSGGFYFR